VESWHVGHGRIHWILVVIQIHYIRVSVRLGLRIPLTFHVIPNRNVLW